MGFSAKQQAALHDAPDAACLKTREIHGRPITYLEGWYAISEANRIFGFDGWHRETLEARCTQGKEARGTYSAVYIAKVRLTVEAKGRKVVREAHGIGESSSSSFGEAHETALKAAETDATKRALTTFGRPFGLELYRSAKNDPVRNDSEKLPAGNSPPSLAPESEPPQSATQQIPGYGPELRSPGANASPSLPVVPTAPSVSITATDKPESHTEAISQSSSIPAKSVSSAVALPAAPTSPAGISTSSVSPDVASDFEAVSLSRPSRYFGRERFHEIRPQSTALVLEAERRATAAEQGAPLLPLQAKIDKSVLTFGEPKRLRDKAHLKFVGSQPCLLCGRRPADAHHLRFAQPRAMGRKVSDEYTVPLCRIHHHEVHQTGNEAAFWEDLEINALEIAKGLWEQSRLLVRP